MKKGIFIYNPNDVKTEYSHAWKNMVYNSYEKELTRGKGIVTVKKSFAPKCTGKALKRALLRATALGVFDVFLNGRRVGEKNGERTVYDELKPGWTDYRFRVFEFEYDVTEYIKKQNVLVATVSNGWWSGRISFGFYGFCSSAFCGEIELTYKDGTSELIASDENWDTTIAGPVVTADIWDGEYYDANIPDASKYPEAHDWIKAKAFTDFVNGDVEIVPAEDRIREKTWLERRPQSAVVHSGTVKNGSEYGRIRVRMTAVGHGCEAMTLKKGNKLILDFGQNMVGRPKITVKASKGTVIEGKFAEFLNDSGLESRGNDGAEGSMYIKNYRTALARFVYVSSGKKRETYTPTHTYYGFRYIEISATQNITIYGVRGIVLGSEMEETATFECDNADVNQLWSNIVWGMRGNYFSSPTDCPQRDERLGWTGDTQIFCGAGSYLADTQRFLSKWLRDASDSQKGFDGAYCDVIPRVFKGNNANAAWGDAGLIVTYRLWLMYNDTEIVAKQYDSMEYYMKHLERYGLEGPNIAYGDWLNYEVTDKRYIAVCYYKYDADLMKKFSDILGRTERAEYYKKLSKRIKAHFAEAYAPDGVLAEGFRTQTCYLLALAFDMLPAENRDEAASLLKDKIVQNNYTLSTGFVGTGILNQTLASVGLNDLAYSLLLGTSDPSWLYSVKQGATTVWERWNSYTKEKGFGNVGMNSFNHYAYGAVAEWMMASVAGIMPDEEHPGFSHFILAPEPDRRTFIPEGQKRICRIKASYRTRFGTIRSEWEQRPDGIVYNFAVPEGSTASARIYIGTSTTVELNSLNFKAADLGTVSDGYLNFCLHSGEYCLKIL